MRELASHLATPIFVIDPDGDLLFFNEPAEPILGRRFDETGPMSREELYAIFKPTDEDGSLMKQEDHPLYIARRERRPAHRRFWIQGIDGVARKLEATAFPLLRQNDRLLGAVGIFWEAHDS